MQDLLAKSMRGLDIKGKTNEIVNRKMHELLELKDLSRWIKLLEIFDVIASTKEYEYISATGIKYSSEKESERMGKVINFIMDNYNTDISAHSNNPLFFRPSIKKLFNPFKRCIFQNNLFVFIQ